MELESYSAVVADADGVIADYKLFEKRVHADLDTRNGPKTVNEMRQVVSAAREIAMRARTVLGHAEAARLAQLDGGKRVRDLAKIVEACEIGTAEADEETNAENVFQRMSDHRKESVTQKEPLELEAIGHIRSRLKGELLGQPQRKPKK